MTTSINQWYNHSKINQLINKSINQLISLLETFFSTNKLKSQPRFQFQKLPGEFCLYRVKYVNNPPPYQNKIKIANSK